MNIPADIACVVCGQIFKYEIYLQQCRTRRLESAQMLDDGLIHRIWPFSESFFTPHCAWYWNSPFVLLSKRHHPFCWIVLRFCLIAIWGSIQKQAPWFLWTLNDSSCVWILNEGPIWQITNREALFPILVLVVQWSLMHHTHTPWFNSLLSFVGRHLGMAERLQLPFVFSR